MLKKDTLKNGTSHIGLYGSAPPPGLGLGTNNQKILVIFHKQFSNCIIKRLKLSLLGRRPKKQSSVVAMVTDLSSLFYFSKRYNLTRILKNFIWCKSLQYWRSYDDSKTVKQIFRSVDPAAP